MSPTVELVLHGLLVTIGLTACGAGVATLAAIVAGLGKLSGDPILRGLSWVYVEVFRGTSALVQLFWFYFAFPILLGIQLPAFLAGVLVLGLNVGSYGAEVVRGAILAVPKGQREAATALGLSERQAMRHVVFPQAALAMLPPAGNLVIELMKASALVSLITVVDLTAAFRRINEHTLETGASYGLALVIYFALALLVTASVRGLERRLARGRDHGGVA